jgi:hypothetical protein
MLREIPLRLREHAKNKQADVDTAKGHVAEIERQALLADGIELIEARVAAARTAMKAAEDAVIKITDELRQIEADRQKVLGPGDEAVYGRAVDLLSEALAREDIRELYQEALRTATKADDQAVSSITSARTALGKAEGEVARIRSEMRETASRRTELEGARDRARHVGYEDPRGTFGSNGKEIIGEVIGGILRGVLQGGALDDVLRDSYRSPQGRSGRDVGGTWSAPSWPGPWGGGSTGGSSGQGSSDQGKSGQGRSGQGNDDSGWRTGGSF